MGLIYIYIYICVRGMGAYAHTFLLFLPGGLRPPDPPDPPLGRPGGRVILVHLFSWCIFFIIFWVWWVLLGVYRPREVSRFFKREIWLGMHSKSCLGTPWGPSYELICKNIYLGKGWIGWWGWLKRAFIEWCSQSTTRLKFGRHYAGIMIIHNVFTVYTVYTV